MSYNVMSALRYSSVELDDLLFVFKHDIFLDYDNLAIINLKKIKVLRSC